MSEDSTADRLISQQLEVADWREDAPRMFELTDVSVCVLQIGISDGSRGSSSRRHRSRCLQSRHGPGAWRDGVWHRQPRKPVIPELFQVTKFRPIAFSADHAHPRSYCAAIRLTRSTSFSELSFARVRSTSNGNASGVGRSTSISRTVPRSNRRRVAPMRLASS